MSAKWACRTAPADKTPEADGFEVRRVERTETEPQSYSRDTPVGEDFHVP
jgi:hypothetical protein